MNGLDKLSNSLSLKLFLGFTLTVAGAFTVFSWLSFRASQGEWN